MSSEKKKQVISYPEFCMSRCSLAFGLPCCVTGQIESIAQFAESSTEAWIKEPFPSLYSFRCRDWTMLRLGAGSGALCFAEWLLAARKGFWLVSVVICF